MEYRNGKEGAYAGLQFGDVGNVNGNVNVNVNDSKKYIWGDKLSKI